MPSPPPPAPAAPRPWPDCAGRVRDLAEHWLLGITPPWWPVPEVEPADVASAILDGTNAHFLFDAGDLADRPLEVIVESESKETSPTGAVYRQQELTLRDPFVGDIPALLLLPGEAVSVPGVVAMPGHDESPEDFRDERLGRFFPEKGLALLIIGFRAWDTPEADHEASMAFLCEGFSLTMVRAYEGLVGLRALQKLDATRGRRLGVIAHSGGAASANLLAWLPANPAHAHVTDIQAEYLNIDEGRLDCETHPALYALWPAIVDFDGVPRAVLELPYEFGPSWQDEQRPDPEDLASTDTFIPFFLRELTALP